jgi:Bacteriophage HK97-gp10, putative tail-component
MAAATFRIEGLTELSDQLARLPAELQAKARTIVLLRANKALNRMRQAYPARTGDGNKSLRNKLKVTTEESTFSASAIVKNTSPLAALFEFGTQARHKALGASTGAMPAGHVFIQIAVEERRAMYEDDFRALLEQAGLTVEGSA